MNYLIGLLLLGCETKVTSSVEKDTYVETAEDTALEEEVVEETEEGDRIANSLGDKQVIILKNHGILTTGSSIDIALWYFLSMEKCCQSQLMAEAAGKPTLIPHEVAIKTRGFIANDVALWASFQPLFDMIVSAQPDLLD